jgi:hypothetical protein
MSSIRIPPSVLPGFKKIADLNSEQITHLAKFLKNLKVGFTLDTLVAFLSRELNLSKAQEVAQTIISFSELLEPDDVNFSDLATNLTQSYNEMSNEILDEKVLEALRENLLVIFSNSTNLKITLKAKRLIYENENILSETKIITDIRLIFNNPISNKNRNALLFHKLHISYQHGDTSKDIFMTLDSEDLKQLKTEVERALEKEAVIKEDYNDIFNFI